MRGDADYVECLHTSVDCLGVAEPNCDADFYANWGKNQPGCTGGFHGSRFRKVCGILVFASLIWVSPFFSLNFAFQDIMITSK
jgi:hypothetical protein